MALLDDINRLLRDHTGYTGDGQGGSGPLPVGDRSTARFPINKRDLRELLIGIAQAMGDPGALQDIIDELGDKADIANTAKSFHTRAAAVSAGQAALPSALGMILVDEGDYYTVRGPNQTDDDPLFATEPRWGVRDRIPTQAVIDALQSALDAKADAADLNARGIIPLTGIGGTASAITATSPVPPAVGLRYLLVPTADSTGVTTVSINGSGPLTIRDSENAAVGAGDLRVGVPVILLQTGSAGARILGPSLAAVAGAGGTLTDGADFNDLREPRTYYGLAAHSYVRAPAGIAGQAFHLRVSIPGAGVDSARVRVLQEVFPVTDPSVVYVRYFNASSPPSTGVWRTIGGSTYRGNPVAGDLDTLMEAGSYVLTGGMSNGPSDFTATAGLLEVTAFGANFATQTLRETGDEGSIWQRVVRPSTGVTQAWNRIGAGGGPSFDGKYAVFLGDSQVENGTWPGLMADRLGLTYTKGGFGGTRLTQMTGSLAGMAGVDVADAISSGSWTAMEAAAQARYDDTSGADDNRPIVAALAAVDWSTVDYIVCHWGTNDWNNAVPIGDTDRVTSRSTIRGAVNYVMDKLLTAHPHLMVLWVGPAFRARQALGDGLDSDTYPNSGGVYLRDLADAIIGQARDFWSSPGCDLYRNSGITLANYVTFLRDQTVDGLHYFGPAHDRVADVIAGSLIAPAGGGGASGWQITVLDDPAAFAAANPGPNELVVLTDA